MLLKTPEAESPEDAPQPELVQEPDSSLSVLTVDTMGMLQSMKKTPTMLKLSDLRDAFNKRIEKMMVGYDEGRVVFDRYMYQSLKNKTRQKRAATSVEYEIHPELKLTMSIKELLHHQQRKGRHACWARDCLNTPQGKVLSCWLFCMILSPKDMISRRHTHMKRLITLIPHQVLASVSNCTLRKLCVWSPDHWRLGTCTTSMHYFCCLI